MTVVTKESPRPWNPTLVRSDNIQTIESFEEQLAVINCLKETILKYAGAGDTFTKSLILNGPPGCGKTFIMMIASLFALAQGLMVSPTALMAERASTLGGIYIHKLFCIPPNNYTPQRLAEVAILRILRRPVILQFLLSVDILCWDEAGQNPAQLLATCDIIMRRLRGSDLFFGGVLLFCTLDHLQLRPIKGLPLLLSPHIMTCFRMIRLNHLVRASQDPNLQRIIDICRMSKFEYELQPSAIDELKTLLKENCTWVDSWDSPLIPNNAMRCFGMRKPAQKAESRYIEHVRLDCLRNRKPFLTVKATDLQQPQQSHAAWAEACPAVVYQLNRLVREPAVLAFFQFAIYEFTFNKESQFSQTQLAILCDVPDYETVQQYKAIPVLCAPPGTKNIDFEVYSKEQLIEKGWKQQYALPAPQHARNLKGGMKARRLQYGLRPHVSNTLHGAMGATLSKIATEINVRGTGNQLWEKGQVVVLVSRTKFCKDLIFVGDQNATLEVICSLVQVQTQYDEYINHLLDVLSKGGDSPMVMSPNRVLEEQRHFLQTNNIPLPEAGNGCCYLLVSLKNYRLTYIGQTKRSLAKRITEHNSGIGAYSTREHTVRPWGLLAFVVGFDADSHCLRLFETMWEERRHYLFIQHGGDITTNQIVSEGKSLLSNQTFITFDLRMVVKGTIVRR